MLITSSDTDHVEQHNGVWHFAECDILKRGQIGSAEYGPGDAPCCCDTEIATRLAVLQELVRPTHGDVLRELGRFIDDNELPAPIVIALSGDEPRWMQVTVSGEAFAAWGQHFKAFKDCVSAGHLIEHRRVGELPSTEAVVHLSAFVERGTAVAS